MVVEGWWTVTEEEVLPGMGGCRFARATMRWPCFIAWSSARKESLPPEISDMVSFGVEEEEEVMVGEWETQ